MFGFVVFIGLAALAYGFATRNLLTGLFGAVVIVGSVLVFL
jgi:hypothetical protein